MPKGSVPDLDNSRVRLAWSGQSAECNWVDLAGELLYSRPIETT